MTPVTSAPAVVPGELITEASTGPHPPSAAFLDRLPTELRSQILVGASTWTVAAGEPIFPPRAEWARAGVVEAGIARAYLGGRDGRQLTVRYARPGDLIGNVYPLAGDRAPLGIAAVTACSILEFNVPQLAHVVDTSPAAAGRLLAVLSRRLEDSYAILAASAFGSMRERVAGHLLNLAHEDEPSGGLVAPVTQQQLADAVGTVREVVARTLRDLRSEGVVATDPGSIRILDPIRLAAAVGRWRPVSRSEPPRP